MKKKAEHKQRRVSSAQKKDDLQNYIRICLYIMVAISFGSLFGMVFSLPLAAASQGSGSRRGNSSKDLAKSGSALQKQPFSYPNVSLANPGWYLAATAASPGPANAAARSNVFFEQKKTAMNNFKQRLGTISKTWLKTTLVHDFIGTSLHNDIRNPQLKALQSLYADYLMHPDYHQFLPLDSSQCLLAFAVHMADTEQLDNLIAAYKKQHLQLHLVDHILGLLLWQMDNKILIKLLNSQPTFKFGFKANFLLLAFMNVDMDPVKLELFFTLYRRFYNEERLNSQSIIDRARLQQAAKDSQSQVIEEFLAVDFSLQITFKDKYQPVLRKEMLRAFAKFYPYYKDLLQMDYFDPFNDLMTLSILHNEAKLVESILTVRDNIQQARDISPFDLACSRGNLDIIQAFLNKKHLNLFVDAKNPLAAYSLLKSVEVTNKMKPDLKYTTRAFTLFKQMRSLYFEQIQSPDLKKHFQIELDAMLQRFNIAVMKCVDKDKKILSIKMDLSEIGYFEIITPLTIIISLALIAKCYLSQNTDKKISEKHALLKNLLSDNKNTEPNHRAAPIQKLANRPWNQPKVTPMENVHETIRLQIESVRSIVQSFNLRLENYQDRLALYSSRAAESIKKMPKQSLELAFLFGSGISHTPEQYQKINHLLQDCLSSIASADETLNQLYDRFETEEKRKEGQRQTPKSQTRDNTLKKRVTKTPRVFFPQPPVIVPKPVTLTPKPDASKPVSSKVEIEGARLVPEKIKQSPEKAIHAARYCYLEACKVYEHYTKTLIQDADILHFALADKITGLVNALHVLCDNDYSYVNYHCRNLQKIRNSLTKLYPFSLIKPAEWLDYFEAILKEFKPVYHSSTEETIKGGDLANFCTFLAGHSISIKLGKALDSAISSDEQREAFSDCLQLIFNATTNQTTSDELKILSPITMAAIRAALCSVVEIHGRLIENPDFDDNYKSHRCLNLFAAMRRVRNLLRHDVTCVGQTFDAEIIKIILLFKKNEKLLTVNLNPNTLSLRSGFQ